MMNLRNKALLALSLLLSLLLALTPAFAAQWDIVSLGDEMREAQALLTQPTQPTMNCVKPYLHCRSATTTARKPSNWPCRTSCWTR